MKEYLKYGTYIVICGTIAFVCATFKDCGKVGQSPDLAVVPGDSAYLPITYSHYKPSSTPFEKPVKPVSKYPKGVMETDVERTIVIHNRSTNRKMEIVETKSGEVHITRDELDSIDVKVTNYVPPIFQFGFFAGIGLTFNNQQTSPSVSLALVRINDKFLAPVIAADIYSIGTGFGYQFYHDLTVTPLLMWNYVDTQRTIKLQVSYQL